MDVNDVLVKYVGSFGRYQKLNCFLIGMLGFFIAFYAYDIVFAAAIPDYWCTPPDLNGTDFADLSGQELKELTIPKEEKNGERVFSSCRLYADDYSENGNISSEERKTKTCNKWTYDQSVYKSTAVTEWDLVCDKTELVATAQSFLMVGKFIGVLLSGFISDRFGRRRVVLCALVMMIPIRLMTAFAVNYIMFVAGYVLSGIFTLWMYIVSFVLALELVGSDWRAFIGILMALLWGLGLVTLSGIAYLIRDRFTLQMVLSIPTLFSLAYFIFLPESPRWLLSRGRTEEGIKQLNRMAKFNNRKIPGEVIEKLWKNPTEKETKSETKENFLDLVKNRVLLFRMLVACIGWWNVNLGYIGLMLNTTNLSGNPYLNMAIGGLMESIGYVAAQFLINSKLGRRDTLFLCLFLGGVSLLITMAVPVDKKMIVTVLAQIGKLLISAAFAIIYLATAELFPSTVRNSGLSGCATFGKTASLVSPYIVHLGTMNRMTPLIIIGTLGAIAGLCILLLPETRGKELHQTIGEQRRSGESVFWWTKPAKVTANSPDNTENDGYSHLLHEINANKKPSDGAIA